MEVPATDGKVITIGDEIPPLQIRTIECDMDLNTMTLYENVLSQLAPYLKKNDS
jgi:hypothetical protein